MTELELQRPRGTEARALFAPEVPRTTRRACWVLFGVGLVGLVGPAGLWLTTKAAGRPMPADVWWAMVAYPAAYLASLTLILLSGWSRQTTRARAGHDVAWTVRAWPRWTVTFLGAWLSAGAGAP